MAFALWTSTVLTLIFSCVATSLLPDRDQSQHFRFPFGDRVACPASNPSATREVIAGSRYMPPAATARMARRNSIGALCFNT